MSYIEDLTFSDVRIYAGKWCCRWCRAKALTIEQIEHEPWCRLLQDAGGSEVDPQPDCYDR